MISLQKCQGSFSLKNTKKIFLKSTQNGFPWKIPRLIFLQKIKRSFSFKSTTKWHCFMNHLEQIELKATTSLETLNMARFNKFPFGNPWKIHFSYHIIFFGNTLWKKMLKKFLLCTKFVKNIGWIRQRSIGVDINIAFSEGGQGSIPNRWCDTFSQLIYLSPDPPMPCEANRYCDIRVWGDMSDTLTQLSKSTLWGIQCFSCGIWVSNNYTSSALWALCVVIRHSNTTGETLN